MFNDLNWLAILACVVSSFLLGGIWYNVLFKSVYAGECKEDKNSHKRFVFLSAFILWAIAAVSFAVYVGPLPELAAAVRSGVFVGLFFVGSSFAVNYVFAGKRVSILLVDVSYHALQFVLYGVILGMWH